MCDNKQVLMTVICSAEKKLLLSITTFDNNVFDQNQKYEDIGDINIFIFDVYKGYQESGQNMMIIGDNFVKGVDPRLKKKSNQQIVQKSSLSLDGQIHQQEQQYQEKMKIREQQLAEQNKQYQLQQEKNIESNETMKRQLEKLKLEIQKYENDIFKIQPDYQENLKNLKEIKQKLMILEEYKKKHEIQNKKLVHSQIKLMEQKLDEVAYNQKIDLKIQFQNQKSKLIYLQKHLNERDIIIQKLSLKKQEKIDEVTLIKQKVKMKERKNRQKKEYIQKIKNDQKKENKFFQGNLCQFNRSGCLQKADQIYIPCSHSVICRNCVQQIGKKNIQKIGCTAKVFEDEDNNIDQKFDEIQDNNQYTKKVVVCAEKIDSIKEINFQSLL